MRHLLLFLVLLSFLRPATAQVTDTLPAPAAPPATQVAPAPPPAQSRRDTRPLKERIDFGFGTSFWITASQTYVELAPVLAYRFPKALIAGVGYRYIYRHDRVFGKDLDAYGPDFFARLNVTRRIYLWTEYEILKTEYIYELAGQEIGTQKVNTYSFFGGLGYVRSFGKRGRGGISFQVLYNFLYEREAYNPYYSPVIYRVGYFF